MLLIDGRAFKLRNIVWDGDQPAVLLCECLEQQKGDPLFWTFNVLADGWKNYCVTKH